MKIIALFIPGVISTGIYYKRKAAELLFNLALLFRYLIYTIIINWCSASLVTYVFKVDSANMTSFESFGFFTKYVFIAVFIAWLIPYIEEIIKKYIYISFQVETRIKKENENTKKD